VRNIIALVGICAKNSIIYFSVAVAKAKRSPHAKIRPSSNARRKRTQQAKGVLTVEGQHACKLASKAQAQTSVGSIRNFGTEKLSLTQIQRRERLSHRASPTALGYFFSSRRTDRRDSSWASTIQCSATFSYALLKNDSLACAARCWASCARRRQRSLSDDIRDGSSNAHMNRRQVPALVCRPRRALTPCVVTSPGRRFESPAVGALRPSAPCFVPWDSKSPTQQFGARRLVPARKGKPRRSGARTSWKEIKMKRPSRTRRSRLF
jgi:hypothetical protein